MPVLIKIVCGATLILGVLQLVAIVFPVVSPQIEGVCISNPLLAILMSLIHLVTGWGIYTKRVWGMFFAATLPFFQYSILYLQIGLPSSEALELNLIFSFAWLLFWGAYYFLSNARKYFNVENSA